jgi:hypothetical protein
MNETRTTLDSWLAAARSELARESPPEWIEASLAARQSEHVLLRRLRADAPAKQERRVRRSLWWWAVPAGVMALLLVGVCVIALSGGPSSAASRAPAFMALTPLETIAAEPRPLMIASEVPRAQLAALGLPVDPARADLPVRAEFLVSRGGAVLAVRFSPE